MTDLKGAEQTPSSLAEEALNQARARFSSSESPVTPEPESVKKKPGRKTAAVSTSNTLQGLQKTLWAKADKMRANMDAAEYEHIVPGLISGQLRLPEAELVVEEICA